jgi:putative sterol carrier protein
MGAGELHPIEMIMDSRVRVEGDVLLALRLPEVFGAVDRIDV